MTAVAGPPAVATGPSRRVEPGRRRRPRTGTVLIGALAVIVLLALIGPYLPPSSITTSHILDALAAPSRHHWLGTDEQGRDVFWRIVAGTRASVLSSMVVVAGYSLIGVTVAVVAAAAGGIVDQVLSRIVDAGLALPNIIFALGLAAVLGDGLHSAVIALIATGWPFTARLLRSVMAETMVSPYIEGAVVLGVSRTRLFVRHVLPNSLDVLLVKWAADVGTTVLALSSLSFIGVGAQPPSPEWGAMVNDAANYVSQAWWATLGPGLAIAVTATVFALLGDRLQSRLHLGPAGYGAGSRELLTAGGLR